MGVDVVVVGAGAAGMLAALALDEDGHRVTIVEQDAAPPSFATPDELALAVRPGAPQSRHPHNFMPQAFAALRDLAPDVLADVIASGGDVVEIAPHLPEGEVDTAAEADLVALASRRGLVDQALRRALAGRERITAVSATATGAVLHGGDVRAVTTTAGDVEGDVVVDASGRRSPLLPALRSAGWEMPQRREDCGITYVTRHYRLPPGVQPTPLLLGLVARVDLPYLTGGLFRGDNDTFSVILGTDPADRELRRALRDPVGYDHALSQMPPLAPWVEAAEPISDVMVMAGLENVVLEDAPHPGRYVPVGDALLTTNPRLGWGVSIAFLHVRLLRETLRVAAEPRAATRALHRALVGDAVGRWQASCDEDRIRVRWWRGEGWEPSPALRLGVASRTDRAVAVAAARRLGVLDPPHAYLSHPRVRPALDAALPGLVAAGPPTGVDRTDLLARLERTRRHLG